MVVWGFSGVVLKGRVYRKKGRASRRWRSSRAPGRRVDIGLGGPGSQRAETSTRRRERVIASMSGAVAARALLFDIRDFAVRGDLAIATGHASTSERREPEQANQTHHGSPRPASEQSLYR